MKKKIFALCTAAMAILLLAGCQKNADGDKETAKSTESTQQKIEKVTLVTSGNGLPYSLLGDDDAWTGIDAEMWAEIEERTGWEVEVKRASFEAIFGELDSGRADVAANCFAAKEERNAKYYASIPYYGDAQCLATATDNTSLKTFADLAGKKIGARSGQASEQILKNMSEEYGFELQIYETLDTGYADVALGRIDAMGGPVTGVNQYMDASGTKLTIMDEKLLANNVVYYFPKTDEGKALQEALDPVLEEMLADGTCAKITEKWLFEDMTKLINKD